jgi:outer membrane protein insertion porin family
MRARTSQHHLKTLVATLLILVASTFVSAIAPTAAQAAVVSRIDVEGNQRVDAATVKTYLLIEPGRSFGPAEEDASLKALFETGLFSDVHLNVRGSTLVVSVVENPVINKVAFEGNKKFKDAQLAAIVDSKERGVFTQAKVQGDVAHILEIYRRTGRFEASVTPQTIQLPNNRVNLVFVVTEGGKTVVGGIAFIGNHAFSDARLRSVIATRQSSILTVIKGGDMYDPDQVSSDEQKLTRYYHDHGYADFQVVSSVADLDRARNRFFITFTITEGSKYRFGTIDVDSSIPGVDQQTLKRDIITDEGDVFSSADLDKSLENITLHLAGSGYPFAQAKPRLDRDPETQTINVTYVVDEGARVYVERIDIRGNTHTRDYVIRREFDLAEGDAFNRVLINRAQRRLQRLGYFSSVNISTEPGSADDRVVVVVNVVEQATGTFSFGVGYSTSDGAVGDISVSEKNFLGRGYNMRIAVGGGSDSKTYDFGFTDPYFMGRRISAGINVYRHEYDANSYRSYDYKTTGGGLTFGFPITENFTVQTGYTIENQEIAVDGDGCTSTPRRVSLAICDAEGETLVSSVFYSLIYNSLDNLQDPHDGLYLKLTQQFAGVGGDVRYLKTTGTGAYYRELMPDRDVVGLIKVQGGDIFGIGEDVRLIDSFFKGGETVRGFESSGFGPRDEGTGDALGGKVYVAGTAEVQFPMPLLPKELGLRAAFFADAGTLFSTDATVDPGDTILDDAGIRSSVGASILWNSPLGPLRADFAQVITKEDYDKTEFFRFGGSSSF